MHFIFLLSGVRHGMTMSLDFIGSSSSSSTTVLKQVGLRATEHAQYVSSTVSGGIAGSLASIVSRELLRII